MGLKADIISAIQTCAEAATSGTQLQRDALKLALGTIGEKFKFRGETREKGSAFATPGFLDCELEGLANAILARSNVIEGLENSGSSAVIVGHLVSIAGDFKARRASDTTAERLLLGFASSAAAIGSSFDALTAGKALARIAAGLTPVAGERLYPSSNAGVMTTVVGSPVVGQILDASGYSDPGNLFVEAVVRIRPT